MLDQNFDFMRVLDPHYSSTPCLPSPFSKMLLSSWFSSIASPLLFLFLSAFVWVMMLSLLDCLPADGSVNVGIYLAYLHQRRDRDRLIVDLLDAFAGYNVGSDHAPAAAPEPCQLAPRMMLARRDSESSCLIVIPPMNHFGTDCMSRIITFLRISG